MSLVEIKPQVTDWIKVPSKDKLAEIVVEEIVTSLRSAVSKQGRASILLSGGSTPQPAYKLLAKANLPWDQLQISLTDERRVNDGHEASNAVMVWQSCLAQHPQVEWFPLWQTGWSCGDIAEIKARTAQMQKPFDVVILGMGEDGHFASLFPGCDASTASLNGKSDRLLCTTAPNAPQERISWSMDALLESKSLMLYITGEKKRLIIEAAVKNQMPEFELPIGYFLRAIERQGKKLKIFWSA